MQRAGGRQKRLRGWRVGAVLAVACAAASPVVSPAAFACGPTERCPSPDVGTQLTKISYGFAVGGIEAATASLSLGLPPNLLAGAPYRLQTTLQTSGLVAHVIQFQSQAASVGSTGSDGQIENTTHKVNNQWQGQPRRVLVTTDHGQTTSVEITPSAAEDEREPVALGETVGALDPLSAVLALMESAGKGSAGQQLVFDGRRLYRLSLTAPEPVVVDSPAYHGSGFKATLRYLRLGGRSAESFFRLGEGEQQAEVFLAPAEVFAAPVPVPVRVEVDTQNFGGLVVLATEKMIAPPLPAPALPETRVPGSGVPGSGVPVTRGGATR